MALSGSFYNYPVGSFGLYCEWSTAQDPIGNYSVVTLKTYLSYNTLQMSAVTGWSKINGVQENVTFPAINVTSSSGWTKKLIYTQHLRISHNTDGTKKGIELAAYFPFYGKYSGTSISTITASTTVDLDTIDRASPTVSFTVTNITINSLKINAVANTTCEEWYYSLDNGATWTSYSTAVGTSAATTVTGLTVNTLYHIKVHARRAYNDVPGISSTVSVRTLGSAVINSCAAFYADDAVVKIYPNVTVYEASFTEKLIVKIGEDEIFTLGPFEWKAGTEDREITLNDDQRNILLFVMPQKTISLTFVLEAYNDSELVGASTLEGVTANTSTSNSGPAWDSPYFTWKDTSDFASITGDDTILIQGHSDLVVSVSNVTAKNFANISEYTVFIGDRTITSSSPVINVGTVGVGGEMSLLVIVTDSRGYTVYKSQKVIVLAYEPPKVTHCVLRRANGIEDVVQLSFTASMSVLKPDGVNDVNYLGPVFYQYKLTSEGDESYSEETLIDAVRSEDGDMITFATNQLVSLDTDKSYNFRLVIEDRIDISDSYYVIPNGIPVLAIRKDRIGINTPDPQYSLDVVGDVNCTGIFLCNGEPIGSGWKYTTDAGASVLRYAGEACFGNSNNAGLMLLSNLDVPANFMLAYYHLHDNVSIVITPIASNGITTDSNKYGTVVIKDSNGNGVARPFYTIMPCFAFD